jgi:hypothetical protein
LDLNVTASTSIGSTAVPKPPVPITGRSIQHERGARSLRLSFTDTDGEASQFVVDVNRPVFGSPSQLGWRRCSGASAASVRG